MEIFRTKNRPVTGVGNRPGNFAMGLLLGFLAFMSCTPVWAQVDSDPIKIGVVNLDEVVAKSNQGQALSASLRAFQEQVTSDGEAMAQRARDLRQQIADGANTMTDELLQDLQKQYEDAQTAMIRFRDDKQREGQQMQEQGLREIEQELEPIFKDIRAQYEFDLILNHVPGIVIMAGDRVDITQLVIDAVNAPAP